MPLDKSSNAASGNRTRTPSLERDFKSRASTCSAMAAELIFAAMEAAKQMDPQGLEPKTCRL